MFKHGESRIGSKSAEYKVLCSMLTRCNNPNDKHYDDYGGRGIKVCKEWDHPSKILAFIAHVGRRPSPKHTIDRIDHNRGYEPGNVRWATMAEQMRNTRRTHLLTVDGVTKCLLDWCAEYGVSRYAVRLRLKRGWSIKAALNRT